MFLIKIKSKTTGLYSDSGQRAHNIHWNKAGNAYNKIGYVKSHLSNLINSGRTGNLTEGYLNKIKNYVMDITFEVYYVDGYTKTEKDIESISELYAFLEQIKLQLVLMKV